MPAAEKPFRLLDLAQELQDMIGECHFSNIFNINKGSSDPPYLEALRTSPHKETYEYARKTYYKYATFQIREDYLETFLDQSQPYVRHINKVRMLPYDPRHTGYVRIDYLTANVSAVEQVLGTNFTRSTRRQQAEAEFRTCQFRLSHTKLEAAQKGLKHSAIKVAVQVFVGSGRWKGVIWEAWTADVFGEMRQCLDNAALLEVDEVSN